MHLLALQDAVIKKLKKYVDDPIYTPESVAKQSRAAMSLCMWSRAMDVYHRVAKVGAAQGPSAFACFSVLIVHTPHILGQNWFMACSQCSRLCPSPLSHLHNLNAFLISIQRQVVEPKRAKLREAEAQLADANRKLAEKQEMLRQVG